MGRVGLVAGLLVSAGMQSSAWSAEWESNFGVAPSIAFTDNVCLNDDNKKSEWISSITPQLNFTGTGRRASVEFAGSLQFHTLDNNDTDCNNLEGNRSDSPIPDLRANGQAELVSDWLFMDASAAASQNAVNQFRAGGGGLNRTGNFNTTRQYSLSPYIARRLKNIANVRVGYRYDEQKNSEDLVGDNTLETVDAAIFSVQNGSPLTWSLSAYSTEVEYDEDLFQADDSSELQAVTLQLGLQVNRTWQINGSVGEEDNDFPTVRDDIDGTFWDVGFLYTPNSRLSIAAGTGDRFFGSTPRADITYRQQRSELTASYSRGTNFSRDIRGGGIDAGGQPGGIGNPTSLARSPVIDERFTLGYRYTGRRHTLNVQGRSSKQRRTDIEDDSTFSSASVTITRNLGRSSEAFIGINWDERESDDRRSGPLRNDSETWWGSVGYSRNIGAQVGVSLEYQYVDRDSDAVGDSFEENRVIASINFAF